MSCVLDCGGFRGCREGMLYDYGALNAKPCNVGCPVGQLVGTCRKGCGPVPSTNGTCAQALCQENVAKVAGSPCAIDDDCRPSKAVVTGTQIQNVYLSCDVAAGACVARGEPARVADWLSACTPAAVAAHQGDLTTPGAWQRFDDPGCTSGVCASIFDGACIRQGCSQRCRSDDECPSGSQCSVVSTACDAFATEKKGVCLPPPASLLCLP